MSSSVTIANAKTLGVKSRFELFGGTIAFKKVTEYTFSVVWGNISTSYGRIIDLSGAEALKNTKDYGSFTINGIAIQKAKLKSFDLKGGTFNKSAETTLTIEAQEVGSDLDSLGGYYADYKAGFDKIKFPVDEISESINLSIGENSIDFSKQIDIKFGGAIAQGPNSSQSNAMVEAAQKFVQAIFDYDAQNGYAGTIPNLSTENPALNSIVLKNHKKFTTETLDLIGNKCSFSQTLKAENIEEGEDYSHSATQTVTIGQDGIITVSEEGKIQALTGFYGGQGAAAEVAYQTEVEGADGARKRLQTIFDNYVECDSNLNTDGSKILFISVSKSIDTFRGTISYTVTASNDKKYEEAKESVFYQHTISASCDNGIWTASERGTIEGLSKKRYDGTKSNLERYPKFKEAYNYYREKVPAFNDGSPRKRIEDFLGDLGVSDDICKNTVTRTETHSLLKGTVQYDRTYSTDKKYQINDGNEYKSSVVSSSLSREFLKKNEFRMIKYPIIFQETIGKERGSQQISAKLLGYRVDPTKNKLDTMIADAKDLIEHEVEENLYNHTESASANHSYMNDVTLDLSVTLARGMEQL